MVLPPGVSALCGIIALVRGEDKGPAQLYYLRDNRPGTCSWRVPEG
jgi:hypothetical protein